MTGRLTKRQRELLLLVANGNTRRQIASWLDLEMSGVDTRLRRIYRELGVSSQPQAVAVALRVGELRLEDVQEPIGVPAGSYPPVVSLAPPDPLSGPGVRIDPKRPSERGHDSAEGHK